ncbi:alpha/beta fold hydrolase [Paenibacillus catalpae]|uniref:alpha/beta fold hydrolase n=1 Tax=Paenibacillus catalpae TaxID=1045775 RepID=UPI000B823CA8
MHGGSQSHLCWNKQIYSELASDFRLVTMDLRGHGLSEKPKNGYDDAQLWADDIYAIIQELNLIQPILIGWSSREFQFSIISVFMERKILGASVLSGL